jgi:hypothetical protein
MLSLKIYIQEKDILVSNENGTYQSLITQKANLFQNNAEPDENATKLVNWYDKNTDYTKKSKYVEKSADILIIGRKFFKTVIRAIKTNHF